MENGELGVRNEEHEGAHEDLVYAEIFVASGLACPVEFYSIGVPDVDQRCVRNVAEEL